MFEILSHICKEVESQQNELTSLTELQLALIGGGAGAASLD